MLIEEKIQRILYVNFIYVSSTDTASTATGLINNKRSCGSPLVKHKLYCQILRTTRQLFTWDVNDMVKNRASPLFINGAMPDVNDESSGIRGRYINKIMYYLYRFWSVFLKTQIPSQIPKKKNPNF